MYLIPVLIVNRKSEINCNPEPYKLGESALASTAILIAILIVRSFYRC